MVFVVQFRKTLDSSFNYPITDSLNGLEGSILPVIMFTLPSMYYPYPKLTNVKPCFPLLMHKF